MDRKANRKQWYEELFENYANNYEKESFTQGTIGECDFIEREIEYNKQVKILDIGCGTGRHSQDLRNCHIAIHLRCRLSLSLLNSSYIL